LTVPSYANSIPEPGIVLPPGDDVGLLVGDEVGLFVGDDVGLDEGGGPPPGPVGGVAPPPPPPPQAARNASAPHASSDPEIRNSFIIQIPHAGKLP